MKIGFFGNTNNFPFSLARAIKQLGHEVLFLVDSTSPLHRPEFRYADVRIPYPPWIEDVSPFRLRHLALPSLKKKQVTARLRGCDAVVVNGLGPSLLDGERVPRIAVLTGSDLEVFGDYDTLRRLRNGSLSMRARARAIVLEPFLRRVISRQRAGIRGAVAVDYFPNGVIPNGDRLLAEIGVSEGRRIFFMMADLDETSFKVPPQNQPLRVFCGARFTWKLPMSVGLVPLDYKGSDVMIRGLSLFVTRTGIPLQIRFVEKGAHVEEAKLLVRETGLGPYVIWLAEMSQSAIRDEFAKADIVFDQFGTSVVGMAGLDAMATGRPLVADGRPELFERITGEPSPICQARTPEEIVEQLNRLLDPEERLKVGRDSRIYVERFFSPLRAAELVLHAFRTSSVANVRT